MRALEDSIDAQVISDDYTELAEELWAVREEMNEMLDAIPEDMLARQATFDPKPFKAVGGLKLICETSQLALQSLRALLPYADETISVFIEVIEDVMKIRGRFRRASRTTCRGVWRIPRHSRCFCS